MRINWTQVLIFGLVVLIVFVVGLSLLSIFLGGWGMMGGWCPWSGGTGRFGSGGLLGGVFGLILTLLTLLIPVGLLILGGVWLVRNSGATAEVRPSSTCPNCGQPVQADWRNCPYCGEELK